EYQMFKGAKKIIIGFSSGPDSVCLLDVLNAIYRKKKELVLVYINHGIRPKKFLKSEEELTRYYANLYQCDYKIIKVNVPKTKKGIEAEARERRYRALINYANSISANRIALGHNLDDRIETFFMNLIRGSGTLGLKSIPPVRLPFVRPLIDVRKVEILNYLKMKKLKFSEDFTNLNTDIRRNYIRHKIIPQFLKLNPKIYETIKRDIELLYADEEFLQGVANEVYKNLVKKKGNGLTIDLNRLFYYNKAIGNRLIMKMLMELKGDLTGIESKHIEMIRGLGYKVSGKFLNLPGGMYAQKIYDKVFMGFVERKSNNKPEVQLKVGNPVEFGKFVIQAELVKKFDLKKKAENSEVFDYSQLCPPLILRKRKTGDIVRIKNGVKKLKEILNEKKIPVNERDDLILLCDREGILWVLGVYRAYRAFIEKDTEDILKVQYEDIN
ncbi:MAG: tRNA lysidine(34) synthetase TilS, partial [candidate division WOR-3 bacterium]